MIFKKIFVFFFFISLNIILLNASSKDVLFKYDSQNDTRLSKDIKIIKVSVAGSFNGWDKNVDVMESAGTGIFEKTIKLNAGFYLYKIVINDNIWLEDLNADAALRKDDGMGMNNFNSGIVVKETGNDFVAVEKNKINISDIPFWAKGVVWYQIFPERFRNGDMRNDPTIDDINEGKINNWKISEWTSDWYSMADWEKENYKSFYESVFRRRYGGDLQGIIDKLDYLQNLGITGIYLNPVFRAPSLHKYDATCHHHIEETFGPDPQGDRLLLATAKETDEPSSWVWTSADKLFLKFVKEVHKRGMKLIIDGVFNHSGRLFFAFQDIIKNGKNSKYTDWYSITKWDTEDEEGFDYKGWFGIKSLPEFKRDENNLNPEYKQYIFNITKRWMAPDGDTEAGVDGWRLDVAYCLPHGFWKEWRQVVKHINPEAYITGEVVEIAPDYLRGDEFDALMNYPFAYTVTEYFIDKKNKLTATEFDKRLTELRNEYPDEITSVMQNLLCSHDTSRLRTLIVNPDMNYRDWGAHFNKSKVECNPEYRIDRGSNEDIETQKLIAIFQMTYIGAPMIYYGDEVGMTGANDPDCRKPMLWDDLNYEDEKMHPVKSKTRPVEKNIVDKNLLEHYKKIINIKNKSNALKYGTFEMIYLNDEKDIFGFVRKYENEKAIVLLNNSSSEQEINLKLDKEYHNKFFDVLNSEKEYDIINNELNIKIKPKWAVILKQ